MLELGTVLPALKELVVKVGPFISKTFEFLISKLPAFLDKIEPILDAIEIIFSIKNIKNSNEILGPKVSKFDGNVENYDNLEEYIDIVENADIKVDPKEKLSPEEYHAYRVLGIAIRIANLSEKMKYEIEPEFISGVARLGLADNLKIIKEIFELAKLENKHLDLEGYLDNKLDVDDDVEVYEFLEEVLEKSGEEKTVTELLKGAE